MSQHFARALVTLVLIAGSVTGQQPAVKEKIVTTDHQNIKATITYEIKTTTFAAGRWLVYIAEPPELPSQAKVKVTAEPKSEVGPEKSPLARPVRYFDVTVPNPVPGTGLTIKQEIQATLRTRKLVPLGAGEKAPKVPPLTAAEHKFYTAPSPVVDFEAKPFQEWLDKKKLRAKKGELPLTFAARVVEVIRADYKYQTGVKQNQNASAVCARNTGDCASMSPLFVAALRANKFPARLLVGRLAKPRVPGTRDADSDYPHVRTEVFVTGVGWVPVDPTYANGDKTKPVTAFIGTDPGDMLVLHVDVDMQLQFLGQQTTAGFLQGAPNYKAFGKGAFDGTFGPSGWELKATPVGKKK
ncbi:MAG TPA: transglutaminase domain-containing protein [Gemmata sp.]